MPRHKIVRDIWRDRPHFKKIATRSRELPAQTKAQAQGKIRWTVDLQAWVIRHLNIYVARDPESERVILLPLGNSPLGWSEKNTDADQVAMIRHIERSPIYELDALYQFVRQQDQYAYYGAWDAVLFPRDPDLVWYKQLYAKRRVAKRGNAAPVYFSARVAREELRVAKIVAKSRETRLAALAAKRAQPLAPATLAFLQAMAERSQARIDAEATGVLTPAQRRAQANREEAAELIERRRKAKERQARFRKLHQ